MRAGDGEGLGDPRAKSFPLELAHPRCDIYGMGFKRAGPLQPRHLQVIADHSEGSTQEIMLITLRLKAPPCLGELRGSPTETLSASSLRVAMVLSLAWREPILCYASSCSRTAWSCSPRAAPCSERSLSTVLHSSSSSLRSREPPWHLGLPSAIGP